MNDVRLTSYAPALSLFNVYTDDFVFTTDISGLGDTAIRKTIIARREATQFKFLDPGHPRYSPKLAAANKVRQDVEDNLELLNGTTPKLAMQKLLRLQPAKYRLVDAKGKTSELAIKEISKVANWEPKGGAPKTPSKKPTD